MPWYGRKSRRGAMIRDAFEAALARDAIARLTPGSAAACRYPKLADLDLPALS